MRYRTLASSLVVASSTFAAGPDGIVGALTSISNWSPVGDTRAISSGLTFCNMGTDPMQIIATSNRHAVYTQNLYRVNANGFEQVGMSWISHSFCALQQAVCSACTPVGGGCASALGVGCSDTSSAGIQGNQGNMSSRTTVNAATGEFVFPFAPAFGNSVFKRLQYNTNDTMPAMNPGARYFLEIVAIAPDDAEAGNGLNNASYREITFQPDGRAMGFVDETVRELPAVFAWQDVDPSVQISSVDIPGDGRVLVASRATDLGDGSWRYTYAVANLNSHDSVRSFTVLSAGEATNLGFADVTYHSGDTIDGTDWIALAAGGTAAWETDSFAINPDANAIRWATSYSFSFDSASPPTDGTVQLETYRSQSIVNVGAVVAAANIVCLGDCDGSGTVDFNDLVEMLFNFGLDFVPPECDPTEDAQTDFNDLVATLFLFGPCP